MTSLRLGRRGGLLLAAIGVMSAVSNWGVDAQQSPAAPTALTDVSQLQVNVVRRPAGDKGGGWHTHPQGQVFWAHEGRALIQERGGRLIELRKHDEPVYTPPNVEHWHGAAPDEGVTYVAIACCKDNYVTWLKEETSDQVYRGKAMPRLEATASDLQAKRKR
jgi:quercetin dioxygenase-like cupin family protein